MIGIALFLVSMIQGYDQFELKDINLKNALTAYCTQTKSFNNNFEENCRNLFHLQPKQVKTSLNNLLIELERQLGIQQDRHSNWKIGLLSGNAAFAAFAIIYGASSSCETEIGYGYGSTAAALNAFYLLCTYLYRKKNSSYIDQLSSTVMGVFSLKNKFKNNLTLENA